MFFEIARWCSWDIFALHFVRRKIVQRPERSSID